MRHALITPLASRDGSVDKDEKLVNCYGEQDPVTKETFVFKRAGIDEGDAVITGNDFYGQGAFSYGDDLFVIIDDILFKWDYVGGLDYGGYWVYVFGSQSGAGGAGGGGYYSQNQTVVDYDISVTYDAEDAVMYEGRKYYAKTQNTGTPPPDAAWSPAPPIAPYVVEPEDVNKDGYPGVYEFGYWSYGPAQSYAWWTAWLAAGPRSYPVGIRMVSSSTNFYLLNGVSESAAAPDGYTEKPAPGTCPTGYSLSGGACWLD